MTVVLQSIVSGVIVGSLYALLGSSVSLVFGLSRVVNFAVGQFVVLAAFVGLSVVNETGSYLLAAVIAVVVVSLVGLLADRLAFRFTYDKPIAGFIVSLGLSLLLEAMIAKVWTTDTPSVSSPLSGTVQAFDLIESKQSLANFALAAVALAALYLLLRKTQYGVGIRAVADDRGAAALAGIPVKRFIATTMLIGAALTAVAGFVILTNGGFNYSIGHTYMLRAFAVALVGGLGSIEGAIVAGLGLGVVENLGVALGDPGWADVYIFGAVILLLIFRPTGLGRGLAGAEL